MSQNCHGYLNNKFIIPLKCTSSLCFLLYKIKLITNANHLWGLRMLFSAQALQPKRDYYNMFITYNKNQYYETIYLLAWLISSTSTRWEVICMKNSNSYLLKKKDEFVKQTVCLFISKSAVTIQRTIEEAIKSVPKSIRSLKYLQFIASSSSVRNI